MSRLSRRGLLGGAAALAPASALAAAAVPAAAAPLPDAQLIAACRAMIEEQRAYNTVYDGPNAIDDDALARSAAEPIVARWGVLLDELEELRATTAAGITARAQALAFHAGDDDAFSFDFPGTMTKRMLDYLLRDAAGLPAGVAA